MRTFLTAAGVLLFIGLIRNQTPLMLLALLFMLALGISALWGQFAARGLTFRRSFDPPHIFPGQPTDYVVEIINGKRLPLPWTEVTDRLPAVLTVLPQTQGPSPVGARHASPALDGEASEPRAPSTQPPAPHGEWRRQSSIALGWFERVTL